MSVDRFYQKSTLCSRYRRSGCKKKYLLNPKVISSDAARTYKVSRPYQPKQFVHSVKFCECPKMVTFCVISALCKVLSVNKCRVSKSCFCYLRQNYWGALWRILLLHCGIFPYLWRHWSNAIQTLRPCYFKPHTTCVGIALLLRFCIQQDFVETPHLPLHWFCHNQTKFKLETPYWCAVHKCPLHQHHYQ